MGTLRNGDPAGRGKLNAKTNFGVFSCEIHECALLECDAKSLVKLLPTFLTGSR